MKTEKYLLVLLLYIILIPLAIYFGGFVIKDMINSIGLFEVTIQQGILLKVLISWTTKDYSLISNKTDELTEGLIKYFVIAFIIPFFLLGFTDLIVRFFM